MKPWTDIRQLPLYAWFRWRGDYTYPFYVRVDRIEIRKDSPKIYFGHKQGPYTLAELAERYVYSYDLHNWQPCGLPTECPECGYGNLGYCIPEPEAPDGWFCTRCKAPHVEGMKKYADPYTRAKMGVSHTKPGLREAGSGSSGDPEGRS